MPNQNTILICRMRIKDDIPTNYIFYWAEEIVQEAKLLGFEVIDLQNENFEESKIKEMIDKHDPFLIFLNSHGTEYSILGYNKKTDVILRCKNDHLFKDRIVYALSCSTGKLLGKSAFNKGCKCYIGYGKNVIFPTLESYGPKGILDDFVAKPFMKVSNEIILTFLKGGTPEEAIKNSQQMVDHLVTYWENQEKPEARTIIKFLKAIKKNQIMYAT